MFQFPGFASGPYEFRTRYRLRGGLPHSDTHGSTPARGSPWLFAACHVLHRLLVPRHPPNALLILNLSASQVRTSQVHTPPAIMHGHHPQRTNPPGQISVPSFSTDQSDPSGTPSQTRCSHTPPATARHRIRHTHTRASEPSQPDTWGAALQAAFPVRHRAKPRSITQHTARSCHTRPETPLNLIYPDKEQAVRRLPCSGGHPRRAQGTASPPEHPVPASPAAPIPNFHDTGVMSPWQPTWRLASYSGVPAWWRRPGSNR
jgi:hypothetical protein